MLFRVIGSTWKSTRRMFGWTVLNALLILNPFSVGMLRATCHTSPGSYTAGISELTMTPIRDNGNCPATFSGYVIFDSTPTVSLVSGSTYSVGQSYAGATVVANTGPNSVVVENGPFTVITPGTLYAPPNYSVFGYDSLRNYTDYRSSYFSVSTQTGGGVLKNWSYKKPFPTLSAPSLTPRGEVAVSGNDGVLHSIDTTTGARKYAPGSVNGALGYIGQPSQSAFPVVASSDLDPAGVAAFGSNCSPSCDVAFLSAQDGRVWAFNVQTGAPLWKSPVLTNSNGMLIGAPTVQLRAWSDSTFRNAHPTYDLIIVGTHNYNDATGNKVYGLRSDTGTIVWTFAPGTLDQINSTPVFDYGTNDVWITSYANGGTQPSIWKISTVTGALRSSITLSTTNRNIDCSPTLNFNAAASYLYTVTNGGDLIALNTVTGVVIKGPNVGSGMVKYTFVMRNSSGGDDIYFANSTAVNKVSFSNGAFTPVWKSTAVPNPSSPVPNAFPTPTALYVGGSDGYLYKLSAADGTKVDTRSVNPGTGNIIGDANIDLELSKIYVGDSSGRIYSYDIF